MWNLALRNWTLHQWYLIHLWSTFSSTLKSLHETTLHHQRDLAKNISTLDPEHNFSQGQMQDVILLVFTIRWLRRVHRLRVQGVTSVVWTPLEPRDLENPAAWSNATSSFSVILQWTDIIMLHQHGKDWSCHLCCILHSPSTFSILTYTENIQPFTFYNTWNPILKICNAFALLIKMKMNFHGITFTTSHNVKL